MIDKLDKALALVFKYELHSFLLIIGGVGLVMHGEKDTGSGILMTGLGIFKTPQNPPRP